MQMRRWWTVALLAQFLTAGGAAQVWAEEEPAKGKKKDAHERRERDAHEHRERDAIIHKLLPPIINQGADLYNSGDDIGPYRLWQGTLETLRPMLAHHRDLQKAIDEALDRAAGCVSPADRPFYLRAALDKIRKATAPRPLEKLPPPRSTPITKTLWDRLGGEKNIGRVVDTWVNLVLNDARVHFYRKPNFKPGDKQLADFKKKTVEWLSAQTGGPLEYKGKRMKEAHKDMGISNAEFDAAEEDLRKALQVHGAELADVNLLMSIVETTRTDIVQPRPAPPPPQSRWQRLGGEGGVARIVNEFMDAALADPKVNFYGDPKHKPAPESVRILKDKLVGQISSLTDGPLKYTGQNMKVAHRGMTITHAQFDAFLSHVRAALEKQKVRDDDIKYLMTKFHDMRIEIVQMPGASDPVRGKSE
jgi:truncated hemoglobin YjbI